jgi:hypothetical protein
MTSLSDPARPGKLPPSRLIVDKPANAVVLQPSGSIEVVRAWPAWQKFAFRYLALHWLLWAFPSPLTTLLGTVARGVRGLASFASNAHVEWLQFDPSVGVWSWPGWLANELQVVQGRMVSQQDRTMVGWWHDATAWFAANVWAPYEPVLHQMTGSGDSAHQWTRFVAIVAASLVLASVWTLLSRTTGYPRLGRWLHLVVRWHLALVMLGYGLSKFYGGQFGDLSLHRLTQPIGDVYPMTMVGTFMQASKPYELFGGACEVVGALLLFHHRTALLGACITAATLTNVVALNWLYGVPVKLSSAHLLLFALALLLPYRERLWALFFANRTSPPVDLAIVKRRWLVWLLAILGTGWVAGHLWFAHVDRGRMAEQRAGQRARSVHYGLWTVETMKLDGQEVPRTDASRWKHFAVDAGTWAWAEEASGRRVSFEFVLGDPPTQAQVRRQGPQQQTPVTWTIEAGTKTMPVPLALRLTPADGQKRVDGERRTLVLKGEYDGKQLELVTVEKVFPLQTGFRLRQELPDGW